MKRLILILNIYTCVCIFTSCVKEKQQQTNNPTNNATYVYMYDYFKPYMFEAGSYWVYENDTTSILDSVVVTSNQRGFDTIYSAHPFQMYYAEFYTVNFHDFLDSSDYFEVLSVYVNNYMLRKVPNQFGNQPILFFGSPIGTSYSGCTLLDSIPSTNINSHIFTNVIKMKITAAQEPLPRQFNHDTYLYFKDSIGLIKTEIDTGTGIVESWSLKRWSIKL
jgi:hypothetical protein